MAAFVYNDSNLGEPEPAANKKETILGLLITFLIISWICVLLRLYVRFRIVHAPGWDDFFVGLYLITMTLGCISICIGTDYGLGKHILLLQDEQIVIYLKVFYAANASYVSSTAFIKLALLLQYLRIFQRGTTLYKIAFFLAVFTALWGVAYGFLAWVPCIPVYDYWNPLTGGKHCWAYGSHDTGPFVATFESHTATNMVLDTAILIVPIPLLFKANSPKSIRIRLAALLTMGCIVLVLASWRLQTIVRNQVATYPTVDPTWYGPISIILAALEVNAASICASVPIFWPVITQSWSGIFVTQEVEVTRELRYHDEDNTSETHVVAHSRNGSEATLSIMDSPGGRKTHYRDSFIMRQVDPLRTRDERDQPMARGGSPKEEDRKWIKI